MKKINFNVYKVFIFLGIVGGSLGIARLIITAFPAFDKFTVFSAFFFPALGWWGNLEANLSKKSEDYKVLEMQMESQDKMHSIALTELQGQFEFLNLRIDHVADAQAMSKIVQQNSEEIQEVIGFLSRQGFKQRIRGQHSEPEPTQEGQQSNRKTKGDRNKQKP